MEGKLQRQDIEELPKRENSIQQIKGIEHVIESEELDAGGVGSLTVTEDKRIASGGRDGNISISSYDIKEKTWKREIYKKRAHNGFVRSLCSLDGNRLLSVGFLESSVKIWKIFNEDITLIKEIVEHTSYIWRVISLSKNRFASCSSDNTVRIWKDDSTYECISTLQHNYCVISILQLRGNEVLVTGVDLHHQKYLSGI